MQEGSWWISAKIYELYVDKFAGDFKGLTRHLDHFEHLCVNALHLLPFYPSPMVDDGYDVSDYRGVRAELGTLEDFAACLGVQGRDGACRKIQRQQIALQKPPSKAHGESQIAYSART